MQIAAIATMGRGVTQKVSVVVRNICNRFNILA